MRSDLREELRGLAPAPRLRPDWNALWKRGQQLRRRRLTLFAVSSAAVATIAAAIVVAPSLDDEPTPSPAPASAPPTRTEIDRRTNGLRHVMRKFSAIQARVRELSARQREIEAVITDVARVQPPKATVLISLERQRAKLERELEEITRELKKRQKSLETDPQGDAIDTRLSRWLQRELTRLRRQVESRRSCGDSPRLTLLPDHGPPGTRVTLIGSCFGGSAQGQGWNRGYGIFLLRDFRNGGCELIASADPFRFVVGKNGLGRGYMTVPSGEAPCFQEEYARRVLPGVYKVGLGCHACGIASFRITEK